MLSQIENCFFNPVGFLNLKPIAMICSQEQQPDQTPSDGTVVSPGVTCTFIGKIIQLSVYEESIIHV